ncbi:TonB-dependent receptor YncD [Salmonella enterica subsp. enterica]|uniref:TonB-dependent receptor YncD n=1 Tax=Salmonella enterica I TaxID=59201 RepID=A0A379W8M6_SALET|nr:TonB-dependent receptor YncD [Salmonella enterica subsp. enterica]
MSRFPLIRLQLSGIFMKIISVRQRLYPALLLPLTFSPVLQAASAPNEQTMIVTATPQTVSELDTPAAVSVIEGEDMRLATPRVNLSESLTSVPGLQVQNRQKLRAGSANLYPWIWLAFRLWRARHSSVC